MDYKSVVRHLAMLAVHVTSATLVVVSVSLALTFFQEHGATYWQGVGAVALIYGASFWFLYGRMLKY